MRNIFYNFIGNLSKRQRKGFFISAFCIAFFTMISGFTYLLEDGLFDQQAAKRWSSDGGVAQISCFYPVTSKELDDYYFLNLEHTIEQALNDSSIMAENEDAKLFIDAVSQTGKITLESKHGSATVKAIGVTNDFFSFHPVSLIGGSYFTSDTLMKDGILIDEDTAWQLFGSKDIVGMEITISSIPHYIIGVVDRKEGHFQNAAGLSESVCYLSIDSLRQYGTIDGSYTYEIVMPNPVKDFAITNIHTALKDEENTIEVVENSKRFDFYPLLLDIKDFGIRSMSQKGIVYPYWENEARAYEDLFGAILIVKIATFCIPTLLCIIYSYGRWKKKKWTFKELIQNLLQKIQKVLLSCKRKINMKCLGKGKEKEKK